MKTTLLRSVFFSFIVFAFGISAQAQTNSSKAQLSGRLTDLSGSGVGGVRVAAQLEASANSPIVSTTSDSSGAYALRLPPGRYRIHFQRSAFVPREFVLDLTLAENHTLDARLEIERLSENVVVTANVQPLEVDRTPAPVDLLARQEIDQRQAVSLPDLLATQTGVSLARTGTIGGLASIFIDGGNSNFAKVLIDGTPVNEPGGAINFSNLTLDNVDKVELVHGAESALYGTDAMSGVVQIVSHRGETRIPELNFFAEGGNFSSARGGAQVSGLLGPFDYSAASSYFQTAGQGVDDAFLNRSLAGNFGYRFSDSNHLRFTVRSNSSFAGTPGQTLFASVDPFAVDTTAYDNLKQFSGNLTWIFRTGSHWTHQISGMESRILDTNAFPDFSFFATDQFNRSGFLEQSTYSFRQGAVAAGYQYEVENAYPNSLGGTHARRNNQAGFLDARWQPLARLTLSAGARAEANTNFGTRVVPRAGLVYALRYSQGFWGDTRTRLSYGQGIEEPTVFESFSTDPCNPGNPSLRPEHSRTLNIGLDQFFSNNRFRVSAGFFSSEFRDLIDQTVGPPNSSCFTGNEMLLFNTDLSRARGVNWSGEAHLNHWLSLKANYSFDDSRVLRTVPTAPSVEQPGNHLLRRPINSGNLWFNANYRRLNFNIAGYFSGRRTDSDFLGLGLTRNPGYARFDLATSYNFARGFSFYGRVANLFDKQYQEALGYPALGRDFRLGLNYRFSGRN
ncbi:MAG TPA: TonB-dependent receptor [Candidatus Angelobacter sp.]|nr:TonB-dependent receptor [Candidatus Angelobacter sp.]